MTSSAWGRLDEDIRGELHAGELEEEEMPSALHEAAVVWLIVLLRSYFRPRGGSVFGSGLRLAVGPLGGRVPDVVVFEPGSKPEREGAVHTVPWIVVEVVSPSPADARRDRIVKPDEYAAFGVRYYWLVDPTLRSFEIWELSADGRYVRALSRLGGAVLSIPGCDGLVVALDELWAELDELSAV